MQEKQDARPLLNHEKVDANSTSTETPEGTTTRDHRGINGAFKLFSPEVIICTEPPGRPELHGP